MLWQVCTLLKERLALFQGTHSFHNFAPTSRSSFATSATQARTRHRDRLAAVQSLTPVARGKQEREKARERGGGKGERRTACPFDPYSQQANGASNLEREERLTGT